MMKMCAAMVRANHDVVLFGRRAPGYSAEDIFRYYGLKPAFELDLVSSSIGRRAPAVAGACRLLTRARTFRPELYYARRRPLAVVASFGSTPLIFDAHEMPIRALDRKMELQVFRSKPFQRLVTNTKALADEYLAAWPEFGSKIMVAHNASDPVAESISPYPIARRPGAPQVGYVGSLYPGKGMETIIKLAEIHDGIDFHVVGGEKEHIGYWQAKGCPPNIAFHGHVRHADLSSYMLAFDVALAPLQRRVSIDFHDSDIGKWTSPLKIFEYMAHGLPIIASYLPSLREVLVDEENSLLVPPDDIGGWTAALTRLVADSSFRKDLARRAKSDFLLKYTWDARVSCVLRHSSGAVEPA